MADINITINGRLYDIACDDADVARVHELGREVDERAQKLLACVGTVSDSRLLVMVGLQLADELAEAREALRQAAGSAAVAAEGDRRLAQGIDLLAQRIEGIAERLERA
ncbi:MAG: cell division protein ZapA [Magnetospirillum sp.]|nr:cell division protein ZapA [Magnetospirillum sp.]